MQHASPRWLAMAAVIALAACGTTNRSRPVEAPDADDSDPPASTAPIRRDAASAAASSDGPASAIDARLAATDARAEPDARAEGSRDAGTTDAAAAPMTGGDPKPCNFKLCESFESYADGAKPDPAVWRSGGVSVASTRAARGKKALKVVATYGESWYMRETRTFPATNGAFYGRLFYWIEQQPTTPQIHWTMIEASELAGGGGRVVRYGGFMMPNPAREVYWFNIETHASGETGTGDFATTIPLRTWHCVEWYFDTPKNQARLWVNGQERTKLGWSNSRPSEPKYDFPDFKSLSIGWGTYQKPDTAFEVWIDEIAVDDQRIGCDR